MIIQQILLGAIAIFVGVVAIKYNYQLVGFTGDISFFERFLGAGGTYLGFKLLAMIVIVGGLLYMTGLGTPILHLLLDPLAGYFSAGNK